MRKIKFRGMDINGNWYYGLLAYTESTTLLPGGKTGWFISNKSGSPWAYQVRPETIGQCTGLKDKSGQLIYEGDIISATTFDGHNRQFIIKYADEDACFGLFITKSMYMLFNKVYNDSLEVIGNIHENPELLEGK